MPVVNTANIGQRSDGTFEQYVPPGVVDLGGGGGGGALLKSEATPGPLAAGGHLDLGPTLTLPAGAWVVVSTWRLVGGTGNYSTQIMGSTTGQLTVGGLLSLGTAQARSANVGLSLNGSETITVFINIPAGGTTVDYFWLFAMPLPP